MSSWMLILWTCCSLGGSATYFSCLARILYICFSDGSILHSNLMIAHWCSLFRSSSDQTVLAGAVLCFRYPTRCWDLSIFVLVYVLALSLHTGWLLSWGNFESIVSFSIFWSNWSLFIEAHLRWLMIDSW